MQAVARCTQSAVSDLHEAPASTAEWLDNESPEQRMSATASAGHRIAVLSVSQARNTSAATSARPSVIAMNAIPNLVPCASGDRSP